MSPYEIIGCSDLLSNTFRKTEKGNNIIFANDYSAASSSLHLCKSVRVTYIAPRTKNGSQGCFPVTSSHVMFPKYQTRTKHCNIACCVCELIIESLRISTREVSTSEVHFDPVHPTSPQTGM